MRQLSLLGLVMSLVAGCAPALRAPSKPTDAALRKAALAWSASFVTRDPVAITSFFADNAIAWFPRGAQPTVGTAAIKAAWTSYFKHNSAHPVSVDSVAPIGNGARGLVYGKYLYKEVTDSTADGGRYIAVWQHSGSRWELVLLSAHKHDDVSPVTFRAQK